MRPSSESCSFILNPRDGFFHILLFDARRLFTQCFLYVRQGNLLPGLRPKYFIFRKGEPSSLDSQAGSSYLVSTRNLYPLCVTGELLPLMIPRGRSLRDSYLFVRISFCSQDTVPQGVVFPVNCWFLPLWPCLSLYREWPDLLSLFIGSRKSLHTHIGANDVS